MSFIDDIRLASKFLRDRILSTALTILSVASGVALIVWLQGVTGGVREAFVRHATPYNLIVGAPGSPVQLVLSGVFFLDRPVGNISRDVYEELKNDPAVDRAVPIAMGDSFRGHAIVGTTKEFFDPLPGEKFPLRLRAGRLFNGNFEAVIGARVAAETRLEIGAQFRSSHGFSGGEQHAEPMTVVGILEPTGGPRDGAVYCSLESIHEFHRHANEYAESGGTAAPNQMTAVLVRPKDLTALPLLQRQIQMSGRAQAVFPTSALYQLFDTLEIWKRVVQVLCWTVVAVALTSVCITLYSFVEERAADIALLRALGASRTRITRLILIQSLLLSLGGALTGIALGHGLMAVLGGVVQSFTGVDLSWSVMTGWEGMILGALGATGLVFGAWPAWRAYRVAAAEYLA